MMARKRRKSKLSRADLSGIAYGLGKFGDMLVMMGEITKIEREGKLDKLWRKFSRSNPGELLSEIANDPDLSAKVAFFAMKLEEVFSMIEEKDPFEMSSNEQIEAGKIFKELSSLLNEIVEGMERQGNP